jgi:hypothetical protein
MTSRVIMAGAAAACLVGVAASMPADADSLGRAGPVRYVVDSVTLPGTQTASAVADTNARCPTGWKSISGGATVRNGGSRALTWSTKDGVRTWYAEAWQSSATATTLRTYAVCLQTSDLTTATTSVFEVPPGPTTVYQTSFCSSGSVVGGGGRPIGSSDDWELNTSYPVDGGDEDAVPDDAWRSHYNYTGHGDGGLLVDAVCLGGAAPTYRTGTVMVPGSTSRTAKAACPAGTHVLGGGAYIGGSVGDARVSATRPFDSKDSGTVPDDGWLVTYTNTSAATALTATAHAFCR